jgi:hypothetical protein
MGKSYMCAGSVRGECGHAHLSIAMAMRCLYRDRRECRSLGGGAYSDRSVMHTDGSRLTRAEYEEYERIQEAEDDSDFAVDIKVTS